MGVEWNTDGESEEGLSHQLKDERTNEKELRIEINVIDYMIRPVRERVMNISHFIIFFLSFFLSFSFSKEYPQSRRIN